jgi:hypothetical protein
MRPHLQSLDLRSRHQKQSQLRSRNPAGARERQKGDDYPDFDLPLAHAVASGVGCRYYWCSVVLALQRLGALPLTQPTHEYSPTEIREFATGLRLSGSPKKAVRENAIHRKSTASKRLWV